MTKKIADFKTRKRKLGKKLKPGNHTNVDFKSKSIFMRNQNLHSAESVESELVTSRNLNLSDLTSQLKHYNPTVVKEAVIGLKELVSLHPVIIKLHLAKLLREVVPLLLFDDADSDVQPHLQELLKRIFDNVSPPQLSPFISLFMAYLGSGMTHMEFDVRYFVLDIVQTMITRYPNDTVQYACRILPNLERTFQLTDVGFSYKGRQYTLLQTRALGCLNLFLSHLFEYNKLKISQQTNSHTHTPNIILSKRSSGDDPESQEMAAAGITNKEDIKSTFIWSEMNQQANDVDRLEIHSCVSKTEQTKMAIFEKLLHRKAALNSQTDSETLGKKTEKEDDKSKESPNKKGPAKNLISLATSSLIESSTNLLSEAELQTMYNLESEESISLFFNKVLMSYLLKMWIEIAGPHNSALQKLSQTRFLKAIIDICYKLLYAAEHLQRTGGGRTARSPFLKSMKQTFLKVMHHFLGHFPLPPGVSFTAQDKAFVLSTNVSFLGLLSFMVGEDPEEEKPTFDEMWELKFAQQLIQTIGNKAVAKEDFSVLLGAFYRIYPMVSEEISLMLWKAITHVFGQESLLSDKQQLLLQFFSNVVLKEKDFKPPSTILEQWAQQLPAMLCEIGPENIHLATYILDVMMAFAKDAQIFEAQIEQQMGNAIIPFFYDEKQEKQGAFLHLSKIQQSKAVQILYYFQLPLPPKLIKALSNCSQNPSISADVVTQIIEMVRFHSKNVPLPMHLSFLFTVVCSFSERLHESEQEKMQRKKKRRRFEYNQEDPRYAYDTIVNETLISLKSLNVDQHAVKMMTPFMLTVFKKSPEDVNDTLLETLLTLLTHAIQWVKATDQINSTTLPPALIEKELPGVILRFFTNQITNPSAVDLCLLLLTTHTEGLLNNVLLLIEQQIAKGELVSGAVLDVFLSILQVVKFYNLWEQTPYKETKQRITEIIKKEFASREPAKIAQIETQCRIIQGQ